MKIYAIKDAALGAFQNLMTFQTDGVAIRSFSDECNRPESQINAHAKDYDLYTLGEWDERTGRITALQEPELVIRALQVLTAIDKN